MSWFLTDTCREHRFSRTALSDIEEGGVGQRVRLPQHASWYGRQPKKTVVLRHSLQSKRTPAIGA